MTRVEVKGEGCAVTDLPTALAALADLGVHPIGLTVDGQRIALRLSEEDQRMALTDEPHRERIVETLKSHGFLYVTLELDQDSR